MKKILFIEDESELQLAVTRILKTEGFEALSALDGEKGLELIRKERPDLVLLDLILPKKDGFEVLEEVKRDKTTSQIPIIILSNLGEEANVERALELGATTYLVKTNYRLEEVVEKVKQTLR